MSQAHDNMIRALDNVAQALNEAYIDTVTSFNEATSTFEAQFARDMTRRIKGAVEALGCTLKSIPGEPSTNYNLD